MPRRATPISFFIDVEFDAIVLKKEKRCMFTEYVIDSYAINCLKYLHLHLTCFFEVKKLLQMIKK